MTDETDCERAMLNMLDVAREEDLSMKEFDNMVRRSIQGFERKAQQTSIGDSNEG